MLAIKASPDALFWAANNAREDRDRLLQHARDAARRARMYDQMLAAELAKQKPND